MAGKKVQVTVPGGIRKVIQTGASAVVGTIIAGLEGATVTIDQLKTLLGIGGSTTTSGGTTNAPATLIPGPGITGGGPLVGAVPIRLVQLTPPVVWNEALLPDDWIGSGGSGGGGGGGGGVSTLAALSDVALSGLAAGQELIYGGVKWNNGVSRGNSPSGSQSLLQVMLADAPVGVWKCNDSGSGFVDSSGNGFNLSTVTGAPIYNYTPLVPTDPNSTFANIPSGANGAQITSQLGQTYPFVNWSVEAVVQFSPPLTGFYRVFDLRVAGSGNAAISYGMSTSGFQVYFTGTAAITVPWEYTDVPVHVVCTCSTTGTTSTLAVYVNGVLMGSATATASTMTGTMVAGIGQTTGNTSSTSPFSIGYVALYAKPLPVNRIVAHANAAGFFGPTVSTNGGGVVYGNVNPDLHPSSPDPTNDEFEGSVLDAKWVQNNFGSSTATPAEGSLVMKSANGSVDHIAVLQQAVSGTFRYRAKVWVANGTGQDGRVGMYVGLGGSSAKCYAIGIYSVTPAIYISRYTNPNSFSAGPFNSSVQSVINTLGGDPVYLEIQYDGTNIIFRASNSGVDGTFIQLLSETAASFLGSAPVAIGIYADNSSTGGPGAIDWFRRMDTSGTTPATVNPILTNITPDTHPSVPTAWDDEFEVGSVIDITGARFAGANPWVLVNNGGATTQVSVVQAGAAAQATINGSGNSGLFYSQAVPATPWEFTWKTYGDANFGFAIYNNSTYKGYYWGWNGGNLQLQSETRNASNNTYSFNSTTATQSWSAHVPCYFKVKNDGTNLIFSYSANGVTYTQLSSQTLASWVSSVTNIALIGNGGTNQVTTFNIDWFRRTL